MGMSKSAVVGLASDYFEVWRAATEAAYQLDLWARGSHAVLPVMRQDTAPEYEALRQISPTPWGRLLVKSVSQVLSVTNQVSVDSPEQSTQTFKASWRANALHSRQRALYQAALGQNLSYLTVLPGQRHHTGEPMAQMKCVPATRMVSFYDRTGDDEFARFAFDGTPQPNSDGTLEYIFRVYDEDFEYILSCESTGARMRFIESKKHGIGVTPVFRFCPDMDLNGQALGEIEPVLNVLKRLDQDTFDRLVTQKDDSWQTYYATGVERPKDGAAERQMAAKMRRTDMLVSSSAETKFGTLPSGEVANFVQGHDVDLQDLSALSQTPPHHLFGRIANMSAEALTAAEAAFMRKVDGIQANFGESWDQSLRSASYVLAALHGPSAGRRFLEEALDYSSQMEWRQVESRSLSQVADALGKIADQLGVPPEMLWPQLPFWGDGDTEKAKSILRGKGLAEDALVAFMESVAGSARNPLREGEDQRGE